ncbi:MAG: 2Fe-2S iron-sulfur cluster binding domain-containing protein [Proteobacteria bacterium]|jgi:glycine betaine catabolism B|nr:2Fe-2S iron-sulfur cluster binding domain-containing protein [Pseudomonadota bacterium]
MPVTNLMHDLSHYLRLAKRKVVYPRLGRGIDFSGPEYRDSVAPIIARLHPKRMSLKLDKIIDETGSVKTYRFVRTDGEPPPFRAGQYVNLFVEIDGTKTSRPYSIASAPRCGYIDLTVQVKDGGFVSGCLHQNLVVGDELVSTGPVGHFYYEPLIDGEELVFLGGGSGITPLMSMIRQQEKVGWPLKIQLLYGSRLPTEVIFGDELKKLAKSNDRFKYNLVVSEPPKGYKGLKGLLDAKVIKKQIGSIEGKTFFICGPLQMYDLVVSELAKLGVPQHKIRRELYGPPADITKESGWPAKVKANARFKVEVEGRETIEVSATEPLINSLERHHMVVPAVCRSGECSKCRVRVLSGEVFMPANAGVREADRTYGYVHACVSYPVSNIKIRI